MPIVHQESPTHSAHPAPDARAHFDNLANSTQADWETITRESHLYERAVGTRVLAHLKLLAGEYGGFPVDRLEHSLQCATLAHRDGRDVEYVVCALLHDIGDTLASFNHFDIAAAILQPFVSAENLWMVRQHGIFQGYYFFHHLGLDRNLRDRFRDQPALFERTAEFCFKYDAPAFRPGFDTLPLAFFAPMVNEVFSRKPRSIYTAPG
jgi:predicted HD phosphohydrolase